MREPAEQKPDLVFCHTYYQVFVACIRAMRAPQKPDLVLASGVLPGAEALKSRLDAAGIFDRVLLFNEQESHSPMYKNPVLVLFFQHFMHRRHIEKYCHFKLDFSRYDRVYFYNDWNELCRYVQDYHVPYIMCEDTFARNAVPEYDWRTTQAAEPFYRLRRAIGYGYLYWGAYKYTTAIETECLAKTGPWADNFVEDSKAALFAGVTEPEKQILTRIFVTTPLPSTAERPCLLLTRPFCSDGYVSNEAEQLALFDRVLREYAAGCTVFIKPHPRDDADYAAAFPDAIILDKNMPSEVLNIAFPFRFDRAVTIGSASLNTLTCAEEKRMLEMADYLGADAWEAYQKRMLQKPQ